jgi:hypothetical protein
MSIRVISDARKRKLQMKKEKEAGLTILPCTSWITKKQSAHQIT